MLLLLLIAAQVSGAETWVNVGGEKEMLVDTSSIGVLNDGRIIFWEMHRADISSSGIAWGRNLVVGYCGESTVDIEAMRGYDANQKYVDSDAKTRVLTLGDSSLLGVARDWVCDHVRVKPVVH